MRKADHDCLKELGQPQESQKLISADQDLSIEYLLDKESGSKNLNEE